ncbi:MAG: hypothetical protein KIS76_03530 [Pyrinomonadaceae bacterium]|nr:hypothetical protein [Pyrinomonadaceae bacterium]
MQPTQIALGTVQCGVDRLNLAYGYGTWGNGVLNAQKNNGNVAKQSINVLSQGGVDGFTAVQKYEYDPLNRLKSAVENIDGDQTPSWKQTFTFDRYGNRNFDEANTTTLPNECGLDHMQIA